MATRLTTATIPFPTSSSSSSSTSTTTKKQLSLITSKCNTTPLQLTSKNSIALHSHSSASTSASGKGLSGSRTGSVIFRDITNTKNIISSNISGDGGTSKPKSKSKSNNLIKSSFKLATKGKEYQGRNNASFIPYDDNDVDNDIDTNDNDDVNDIMPRAPLRTSPSKSTQTSRIHEERVVEVSSDHSFSSSSTSPSTPVSLSHCKLQKQQRRTKGPCYQIYIKPTTSSSSSHNCTINADTTITTNNSREIVLSNAAVNDGVLNVNLEGNEDECAAWTERLKVVVDECCVERLLCSYLHDGDEGDCNKTVTKSFYAQLSRVILNLKSSLYSDSNANTSVSNLKILHSQIKMCMDLYNFVLVRDPFYTSFPGSGGMLKNAKIIQDVVLKGLTGVEFYSFYSDSSVVNSNPKRKIKIKLSDEGICPEFNQLIAYMGDELFQRLSLYQPSKGKTIKNKTKTKKQRALTSPPSNSKSSNASSSNESGISPLTNRYKYLTKDGRVCVSPNVYFKTDVKPTKSINLDDSVHDVIPDDGDDSSRSCDISSITSVLGRYSKLSLSPFPIPSSSSSSNGNNKQHEGSGGRSVSTSPQRLCCNSSDCNDCNYRQVINVLLNDLIANVEERVYFSIGDADEHVELEKDVSMGGEAMVLRSIHSSLSSSKYETPLKKPPTAATKITPSTPSTHTSTHEQDREQMNTSKKADELLKGTLELKRQLEEFNFIISNGSGSGKGKGVRGAASGGGLFDDSDDGNDDDDDDDDDDADGVPFDGSVDDGLGSDKRGRKRREGGILDVVDDEDDEEEDDDEVVFINSRFNSSCSNDDDDDTETTTTTTPSTANYTPSKTKIKTEATTALPFLLFLTLLLTVKLSFEYGRCYEIEQTVRFNLNREQLRIDWKTENAPVDKGKWLKSLLFGKHYAGVDEENKIDVICSPISTEAKVSFNFAHYLRKLPVWNEAYGHVRVTLEEDDDHEVNREDKNDEKAKSKRVVWKGLGFDELVDV